MYKILLGLRYLRSRLIAWLAILGVTLCVAMMLIVVSVMSGFLDKVEAAAKGLFGDIVVEPAGERGLGYYDEFIERIEQLPRVEAAEPFILTVAMLRIDEGDNRNFRQHVQVAGIRLPGRAEVSSFEEGLFVQEGAREPTFAPPIDKAIAAIRRHQQKMREIIHEEFAEQLEPLSGEEREEVLGNTVSLLTYLAKRPMTSDQELLLDRMFMAFRFQNDALLRLRYAKEDLPQLHRLQKELEDARAVGATREEIDSIEQAIDRWVDIHRFDLEENRVILGLGIPGLSFRTEGGKVVRYIVPGHRVILQVAPLGKEGSLTEITPNTRSFTVIDDNRSDVSSIDKEIVYIPFATAQLLNNMSAMYDAEDPLKLVSPARCSQVHVKVRKPDADEAYLRDVASQIRGVWQEFRESYAHLSPQLQPTTNDLIVETWRQRQSDVVQQIENQRTLGIIVVGIVSLVAVVLIFVILYTIVVQKTREIGVLKAVGASSGGVASLFFFYGAAIGLIGSAVGIVIGWVFVKNINPIHKWVGEVFGYQIWTRDQYMFEKIPNTVDWSAAGVILAGSILAGLVGALLPAVRAARMQPVEALRYE